ncbi:MAG: HesA/MoeB/ThiF family protein [Paracoccus sp. (in: a-proteobacteria)]|nr:HesA/MoeB/ThiF family protein [Paracoccus sp. (in: a-proteobacteria)]
MALLLPLGLISVAAMAWIMGWSLLRMLAAVALSWLAVFALLLAAPAAEIRAFSGLDLRVWIIIGWVVALMIAYGALLDRLRKRAGRASGADDAPGLAPAGAAPARGAADAAGENAQDDPVERYARHLILREIGGPGQARLRNASVLVVGAGGLGAPVLLYLAGAGIGRITVADPDTVSISNLQRQILYRTADAGRAKGLAAAEALRALNPHIRIDALRRRVGAGDHDLIAGHDLVIEGCDTFEARAAINAACADAGVPLISGAIAQWEGQVSLFDPAGGTPCLACIFPQAPAPGLALSCAEAGVAGPLPGVIGTIMALEAVKHITGAGEGLSGRMLIFDGLSGDSRTIRLRRRPDCQVCATVPPRNQGDGP